ncbi:transposase [Lapidilactobacillus gannanensis]|uniref:Mutator family transposase n=1 Tax=Lapidilactobacillus gannanensis TaxID=2486002 RepID=A0ABW4BM51_9LACO|nr:transposase [Lapidilactobacillus gannanensis]
MTASAKATITALSNNVVINESFRKQLEKMTNMLLQDELTMFLGYESFHRPQSKKNYRNGFYPRQLWTHFGWLDINVPRDRGCRFIPHTFDNEHDNYTLEKLALSLINLDSTNTNIHDIIFEHYRPFYEQSEVLNLVKLIESKRTILKRRYQNSRESGIYQQEITPKSTQLREENLVLIVFVTSFIDTNEELLTFKAESKTAPNKSQFSSEQSGKISASQTDH